MEPWPGSPDAGEPPNLDRYSVDGWHIDPRILPLETWSRKRRTGQSLDHADEFFLCKLCCEAA